MKSFAANTEESASACEKLSSQAIEIKDMVDIPVMIVKGGNGSSKNRAELVEPKLIHRKARLEEPLNKLVKAFNSQVFKPQDMIPLDDDDGNFEEF